MADIYVKKTGNDSSGNGSNGSPYLTIQKGLDEASAGDRILIGAGTYTETGLNKTTTDRIKLCTLGDGDVVIDGTTSSTSTNTIRPYTGWVIDGSTGSYDYEFKIIGGGDSCVKSYSGGSAVKLKNLVLVGKGDYATSAASMRTRYGVRNIGQSNGGDGGSEKAEIQKCIIHNIYYKFIDIAYSPAYPIKISNLLCYDGGYAGNTDEAIDHPNSNNEFYFVTLTNFVGGKGIMAYRASSGTKIKNCIVADNTLSVAGIDFNNTGDNVSNNCVYNNGSGLQYGNYYNHASGSTDAIDATNLEQDPSWVDNANITKNYRINPKELHYPGSSRTNLSGSALNGKGVAISGISTGLSGTTRQDPPSIGAFESAVTYLFENAPTGDGLEDAVLKDFTINHYNRLSKEVPRNTDQIPFGKLVKSTANLKDRAEAYKLTKESK